MKWLTLLILMGWVWLTIPTVLGAPTGGAPAVPPPTVVQPTIVRPAGSPTSTQPGGGGSGNVETFPAPTIDCKLQAGCTDVTAVINSVSKILITVGGSLFFFMFLVGGIQYLSSAGSSQDTEKAKNTMIYAVVGLVVIFGAYALLNFFVSAIT